MAENSDTAIVLTPLERAARALIDINPTVSGYHQTHIDMMMPKVRAVIEAIRIIRPDTSDDVEIDMLVRGRAVLPEHDEPMQEDAANCWSVMIDAMLEEGR